MTAAWMRGILERYGQEAVLEGPEGEETIRAFLQPLPEKGEAEVTAMTELGSLDDRLWQYLGQRAVAPGDALRWEGLRLRVRSSRPWYLGSALVYWWASLERAKEAAE